MPHYKKQSGLGEDEKMDCRRKVLFKYESFFETLVLETRYVTQVDESLKNCALIDARGPFVEPCFESEGGFLPENLKLMIPLEVSEGYSANYLWSEDKKTFLAYIRNSGNYSKKEIRLGGEIHRIPTSLDLKLVPKNFPDKKLKYKLYDLVEKQLCQKGEFSKEIYLNAGNTKNDFFVLVIPLLNKKEILK